MDAGGWDDRNLGIIDLETVTITDIGPYGNLNEIGFVNDEFYGTTGNQGGQNIRRSNENSEILAKNKRLTD